MQIIENELSSPDLIFSETNNCGLGNLVFACDADGLCINKTTDCIR